MLEIFSRLKGSHVDFNALEELECQLLCRSHICVAHYSIWLFCRPKILDKNIRIWHFLLPSGSLCVHYLITVRCIAVELKAKVDWVGVGCWDSRFWDSYLSFSFSPPTVQNFGPG